ncbi:hypothetical protein PMAYCL1PPCAC_11260, partial [Pristionchus mayeri]
STAVNPVRTIVAMSEESKKNTKRRRGDESASKAVKDSEDNRERRSEENGMKKKHRKEEKRPTKDEDKIQRESTRNGENQTDRMEMRDSVQKENEDPLLYEEEGYRNDVTPPTLERYDHVEGNSDMEVISGFKPFKYKKVLLERWLKEVEGKRKKEDEE